MNPASVLFYANRILCSPLESLYTLLVFIVTNNLGATPLELTIITCIKPISALFSYYTSSFVFDQPQRIRTFLWANNILGCAPCFLFPFFDNVWFYIFSYAAYMVTRKAAYPTWIEILKSDLSFKELSQTVSRGTSIYYIITIFLPPLICFWMDHDENIWRTIFIIFSVAQMLNNILILFIHNKGIVSSDRKQKLFSELALDPIKKGWTLLLENQGFRKYQILYFLGGAGIIAIQPILPIYFKENLHLSYTQLGLAFSFCKGISFVAASPYWARQVNSISLYKLNGYVNLLICIFIAFLLASNFGKEWLYAAYIFYGIMQAGSELSWNISGPVFSANKDSTIYSGINLAVVGVRGCICPFLGQLLFISSGINSVFLVSFLVCFIGGIYGFLFDARRKVKNADPLPYQ